MANSDNKLEIFGKESIPDHGALIVTNRISYRDLLELEKLFKDRKLVYLIESTMDYDPLLQDFLEKDDIEALEFSCSEETEDAFKRELHRCMVEEALVVFVPGITQARLGQTVTVPAEILKFVTGSGAPVLPLFVDHPEETCLSTEDHTALERVTFSFGHPLTHEGANLANFTENLLIAAERAYSARPLLEGNIVYEIIKGLKKHGATTKMVDGNDYFDPDTKKQSDWESGYDKLLAAAVVFAKKLKQLTKKKRVGIVLPPGRGGLVANLGVMFAGKVPVNLNYTAGPTSVQSCVEQADLEIFISANKFIAKSSEKFPDFPWPEKEKMVLLDEVLPPLKKSIILTYLTNKFKSAESIAKSLGIPKKGGREEAVLLFTSGSSGAPKGVVLTHRNLLANVNQFGARINLRSDDSVLGCLPLFHSFGCTVTMWYPMIEGVNLVTYPSPLETARLVELIHKNKISLVLSTPTFLRGYLRNATKEQMASVKMVVTGAEKLPQKLADSFHRRFGKTVYEGYGLTETSPVTNVNLPDTDEILADDSIKLMANHRAGSVGLFIPGVAVRITDPETHEPMSLHSSGMIWLKGANIFDGYLNQPDKTKEVIVNDWFMTGDIGRLDEEGFLYIEGRLSRFSKIGGEMVPHETVEAAVNEALDLKNDERKIAIVGLPDEAKGEILVLITAQNINSTELRTKLKEAGISALWIPKKIVNVDEIPMLASGKLDIKGCEEVAKANV